MKTSIDKVKWMSALALDSRLNAAALRVGLVLCGRMNLKTGRCNPSIGMLEDDLCLSRSTIMRARSALKDAGWIDFEEVRGRGSVNQYTLKKGLNVETFNEAEKGPEDDTFYEEKGISDETFPEEKRCQFETEKVSILDEKGVNSCMRSNEGKDEEKMKKQKHSVDTSGVEITEGDENLAALRATFADLKFDQPQIATPKVMGMLRRWADASVTPDDVRAVVSLTRERKGNDFTPAYLDGPMADYLQAKDNPHETSSRVPTSRREHHAHIAAFAERQHAEAVARELGDRTVSPVHDGVSGEVHRQLPGRKGRE